MKHPGRWKRRAGLGAEFRFHRQASVELLSHAAPKGAVAVGPHEFVPCALKSDENLPQAISLTFIAPQCLQPSVHVGANDSVLRFVLPKGD